MTLDQARELLTTIFREVIDGGEYDRFDDFFRPDAVEHTAMGDAVGKDGFTGFLEGFRAALPDFHHDLGDFWMVSPDVVVFEVRVTGTFSGEFMGQQGHGERLDLYVTNAARLRDGRVTEHWALGPESASRLLAQLGVQPAAA